MEDICKIINKDIVFLDLETTGVDLKVDEIVEFYGVKFTTKGERIELHLYINPSVDISPLAFDAHGLSKAFLSQHSKIDDVYQNIYDFIIGCDLGGYNCLKFDIPFLFEVFTKFGIVLPINVRIVDSYNLVNKMEPRTLSGVYKNYFGRDLESAHSASADTQATVDIFIAQVAKYQFEGDVVGQVSTIVRGDKNGDRIIDLSGWFIKRNGEYFYNRGMYKETLVYNNIDYLRWMIGSSKVENNSRIIAHKIFDMYGKL
jgi:DNA polymerase-3 subunit epsilon